MHQRPVLKIFGLSIIIQVLLVLNITTVTLASSNIEFSEIMYDLEGSDTDRGWIELYNGEETGVDLTNWRLDENGTQHILTLKQGSTTLASGSYAVISGNYEKFKEDNPSFSGTAFDSSFSLSNTGETLKILK